MSSFTCCPFVGPKYDSAQPSYPGFERDVFKTVSDYFYSLPQPVLTYELYELFINVLGGYFQQLKGFVRAFAPVQAAVFCSSPAQTDRTACRISLRALTSDLF